MKVSVALVLLVTVLGAGCRIAADRRLVYESAPSRANHGLVLEHAVYTPPGFSPNEELPLVVFLHGGGDWEGSFDQHGVTRRLDRAIAEGDAPRAVILLPDGELGFWQDWYDDSHRYRSWVVHELIPRIQARYHTRDCPQGCHVMGVSMGSIGALSFAHHHPDVFRTVTAISGPVMDTEGMLSFLQDRLLAILIPMHRIFGPPERDRVERDDLYLRWTSPEATGMEKIFLAWGSRDRGPVIEGSEAFHEHLAEHAIPHRAYVYEGGHGWAGWGPVIEEALRVQVAGREPTLDGYR